VAVLAVVVVYIADFRPLLGLFSWAAVECLGLIFGPLFAVLGALDLLLEIVGLLLLHCRDTRLASISPR